jgi:hypothetical protein
MESYTAASGIVSGSAAIIDEIGKRMDSSGQTKYICPVGGEEVWVLKGAPYRGACAKCLANNPILSPVRAVTGFFKGLFS